MEGSSFEEPEFFRRIASSGVRALLIGRRALIALGIPVVTADYDFWVHPDDAGAFNAALAVFELYPNRTPEEASAVGRYVLENDEHVDVLVARQVAAADGTVLTFDETWGRRVELEVASGTLVAMPSLDDLITTKRFGSRPKDAEDIRLLEAFRDRENPDP